MALCTLKPGQALLRLLGIALNNHLEGGVINESIVPWALLKISKPPLSLSFGNTLSRFSLTSRADALQENTILRRPRPAFCKDILSEREGTQVAAVEARQKNSWVHVSFTRKKLFLFFAGGGLDWFLAAA